MSDSRRQPEVHSIGENAEIQALIEGNKKLMEFEDKPRLEKWYIIYTDVYDSFKSARNNAKEKIDASLLHHTGPYRKGRWLCCDSKSKDAKGCHSGEVRHHLGGKSVDKKRDVNLYFNATNVNSTGCTLPCKIISMCLFNEPEEVLCCYPPINAMYCIPCQCVRMFLLSGETSALLSIFDIVIWPCALYNYCNGQGCATNVLYNVRWPSIYWLWGHMLFPPAYVTNWKCCEGVQSSNGCQAGPHPFMFEENFDDQKVTTKEY